MIKNKIKFIGLVFLLLGFLMPLFKYYKDNWFASKLVHELYSNFCAEFISLAITILIIDYLYDKKEKENNKKRLIRELGCEDIGLTSRALKEIKELGYINDGSLNNADFSKATLNGLDFSNCKLNNLNFSNALLISSDFSNSELRNCDFSHCNLNGINFNRAKLVNVKFHKAELYGATFHNSKMQNSDLLRANLDNCEFIDAEIEVSKFEDTFLRCSNLFKAKFKACNFLNSDFTNANLEKAYFERSDFNLIIGSNTILNIETAEFIASVNFPNT